MPQDAPTGTRVTVLSGGVGGARFLQGLLQHLAARDPAATVTVVANTADDIWLHGLKVCPDLDTVNNTGGITCLSYHESQLRVCYMARTGPYPLSERGSPR